MNYALIISIYAACLSTFIFIWNIYKKRGRIKIKWIQQRQMPFSNKGELGEIKKFHLFTIVNVGVSKRIIKKPGFEINKATKNEGRYLSYIDFDEDTKYPYSLETGQELELPFPVDVLIKQSAKSGAQKVRLLAEDTKGKKYKSKWVDISFE